MFRTFRYLGVENPETRLLVHSDSQRDDRSTSTSVYCPYSVRVLLIVDIDRENRRWFLLREGVSSDLTKRLEIICWRYVGFLGSHHQEFVRLKLNFCFLFFNSLCDGVCLMISRCVGLPVDLEDPIQR